MTPPIRTVLLQFDQNDIKKKKKFTDGLSGVVQIGDTLWVVNDESLSVERLSLSEIGKTGYCHGDRQKRFMLKDLIDLPGEEKDEADLEGLAYVDGYLWLIGSHSLKRQNPKLDDAKRGDPKVQAEAIQELATLKGDGNRYLLARIPIEENGGAPGLMGKAGGRHAARLHGDKFGDELIDALRGDRHISPFLPISPAEEKGKWRGIPSKDNGFDIEGLAAVGNRLFIGLRGPVLRGWAVILEIEPEEDGDEWLKLKPIAPDEHPGYHKHFLQLGGLGVRDICVDGADMLILAGPTMDIDGPVKVFRWPGGANPKGDAIVEAGQLQEVLEVPFGVGNDHAEGISLFNGGDMKNALIVVYDTPSKSRQTGQDCLLADAFTV